ncbi:hypothetical protein Sa4125_26050 [Aureimonas sp. SA4125]|uniref:hypothetical protein n=1 Tax=Aureimonas sp. SA4125 TaxID=2826993 RepID=UPI001CC3A9EF|nr:hypothetical protein [Aureimonas sp. SA4125]BDA85063.1 hypothetical protein Sa4125_26050 [Aureimonas sp. SA4125]
MAEVTNELMFELMKRMHQEIGGLRLDIREVKPELSSMRGTIVSMQNDIHNIYGVLGRQDDRLDRIERRLDLRELAEPLSAYNPHP